MTMLVNRSNVDPLNGAPRQEVVPGSADDPFKATEADISPTIPDSPSGMDFAGVTARYLQTAPSSEASPAEATPPSPSNEAETKPSSPAPEASKTPLQEAIDGGTLDEYIRGLVAEQAKPLVGDALRAQQSSYDKTITSLKAQLDEALEAQKRAEREGKLEDLSEEEQEILRNKWEYEDKLAALDAREAEIDAYWKDVYVVKLAPEAERFGVTADELAACATPEDMDKLVAERELSFYRNGGIPAAAPSASTYAGVTPQTPSEPEPKVPAGAHAPSDTGGESVVTPPRTFNTAPNRDAMLENLSASPWVSLPIPN